MVTESPALSTPQPRAKIDISYECRRNKICQIKISTDLLEFIENSPSCFHAVQTTKEISKTKHGFTELSEDQTWNLTPGNDYFVTRNGSSIIAFSIPESVVLQNGFRIIAKPQ